jgi:hypothetical protein
VDFEVTDQLLIRYSAFVRHYKKWEYNGRVHQLLIDFENASDSEARKLFYNILTEFGVTMKL